ncbi:hypothetical protein PSPO01_09205 [Paraphaeosphaeria sporulosa]
MWARTSSGEPTRDGGRENALDESLPHRHPSLRQRCIRATQAIGPRWRFYLAPGRSRIVFQYNANEITASWRAVTWQHILDNGQETHRAQAGNSLDERPATISLRIGGPCSPLNRPGALVLTSLRTSETRGCRRDIVVVNTPLPEPSPTYLEPLLFCEAIVYVWADSGACAGPWFTSLSTELVFATIGKGELYSARAECTCRRGRLLTFTPQKRSYRFTTTAPPSKHALAVPPPGRIDG